jgi:hypothetical protein
LVGVRDRRLEEAESFALTVREVVVVEASFRGDERPRGHVRRDQLADHRILQQFADERAFTTADVRDPPRAELPQYAGDRRTTLDRQ